MQKAVDSVISQAFVHFECIIVDDGSTDDTNSVFDNFFDKRVKYFFIENSERGFARNYGIKSAIGRYIVFLDSDDYLKPNHLSEAKLFIEKQNFPAFFFQRFDYLDLVTGKITHLDFPKGDIIKSLCRSNTLCPTGAFVEANVMLENLFDEDRNFTIGEDLYVWLKIGSKHGFLFSDVISCVAIDHPNTTMNNLDPNRVIYCRDKIVLLLKNEPSFGRKYLKYLNYLYANQTSLAAMIFSERRNYSKTFLLLFELLVKYPLELFRRRTLVIFRNLFLSKLFS